MPDDQTKTGDKMKISQKLLSRIMSTVAGVADKKSTMDVLANVFIDVRDTTTVFRCTDLTTSISVRVPIGSDEQWTTTVDAKLFADIAKVMPKNGDIEINHIPDAAKLVVRSGKSKFDLLTLPAEEFPIGKELQFEPVISLSSSELLDVVSKTSFSMGTDSTRPHICSMLFELEENKIRSVTTDGHRMTIAESATEHSADEKKSLVVPSRCINEVKKMAGESGGEVGIMQCDDELLFEIAEQINDDDTMYFELKSKVLSQDFPPYEKVLPKQFGKTIEFDKNDMIEAAKRLRIMTAEKKAGIIKLSIGENELELSAAGAALGNASESISATCDALNNFEIGLNIDYLIDACSVSTGENLRIQLNGKLDPSMLEDDSNYKCVIMPMRI